MFRVPGIVEAVLQPIKVTVLQANAVNPGVCSSVSHRGRQRLQMRMHCLECENCTALRSAESKLCLLERFLRLERSLKHSGFVSETVCRDLKQAGSSENGRVDVSGSSV